MPTVLITGSNRGVGLALVQEYLQRGATVIAACRNPDEALDLKQWQATHPQSLAIAKMDVSNQESVNAAAKAIAGTIDHIDILINNAGIHPDTPETRNFGELEYNAVAQVVNTNAIGAAIVSQAFVGLLEKGENPRIVMISSRLGSIGTVNEGSRLAYRMSKSALNMVAKSLSFALREKGITVITTHPGWVQTDMGGESAPVAPQASAAGLATVIDNTMINHTGMFLNFTGEEIVW